MRFTESTLDGVWIIESESHRDDRGFFARLRCAREFEDHGIQGQFVQTNLSYNRDAGTFRGLHYQAAPSREGKLVRCVSGGIADIVVDLRRSSPGFLRHEWFDLDAENMRALFVPPGFAHGFFTRADDTLVLYEMTDYFAPELGRGVRWNDPALGIELPGAVRNIHPRDEDYPDLVPDALTDFDAAWQ